MFSSLILSLFDVQIDGTPSPGVFDYHRPGGVFTYLRPDGTSIYKRP